MKKLNTYKLAAEKRWGFNIHSLAASQRDCDRISKMLKPNKIEYRPEVVYIFLGISRRGGGGGRFKHGCPNKHLTYCIYTKCYRPGTQR